jgi:predicted transcriptional regulator
MDADEIRDALRASGDRRARAMHDARLGVEARNLVRRGHGLIPVTEMARLLGVTRKTVHDLLKQDDTQQ